jgi:hypothetical protein
MYGLFSTRRIQPALKTTQILNFTYLTRGSSASPHCCQRGGHLQCLEVSNVLAHHGGSTAKTEGSRSNCGGRQQAAPYLVTCAMLCTCFTVCLVLGTNIELNEKCISAPVPPRMALEHAQIVPTHRKTRFSTLLHTFHRFRCRGSCWYGQTIHLRHQCAELRHQSTEELDTNSGTSKTNSLLCTSCI